MQQLEDNKICKYCLGCNKLLDENFKGVIRCKNFMQGQELDNYYKQMKERKKWDVFIEN